MSAPTKTISKRNWAIALAESGKRIFPLVPNGKTPANPSNWRKMASSDPARVAEMWTDPVFGTERDYNIGMALGPNDLVFDEDVSDGKRGGNSRAVLEMMYEDLPKTFTVRSASGGLHRHLTTPTPVSNSSSKVGLHIDIKSLGGYVVAPGSTIDGVEYEVVNIVAPAPAPQWLIDMAGEPRARPSNESVVPLVDLDTPAAIANAVAWLETRAPASGTYFSACGVKDFGVSEDKCLELLLEHWPPAQAKGEEHVAFRVANAYRYGQNPPGIRSAEAEFEDMSSTLDPVKEAKHAVTLEAKQGAKREAESALQEGWQRPEDLWQGDREPRGFPAGIVPDYVERVSRDRARRIGVNDEAMAAAVVAGLSSLVPAKAELHMRQWNNQWSVRCVLWLALIGAAGTKKTPTLGAAMAFPRAAERYWRECYAKDKAAYDEAFPPEKSDRQGRKKKAERPNPDDAAVALSGRPGVSAQPPAEPFPEDEIRVSPIEPTLRRKIVNDATTEALSAVLAASPDSAPVLMHSDELMGLIGSMDAYRARGDKDRPFYLQAKEGGDFTIDRQQRGTTFVKQLAVAVIGGIQNDKLAKIAPTMVDDGLFQRFSAVLLYNTSRGSDFPDDEALDASIERVALALAGAEPQAFRLSPGAGKELEAVQDFEEQQRLLDEVSPALKTWLSKTPNEFGRHCLAFHLIEWASSTEAACGDPPPPLVSRATAIRARRYIQELLYPHARYTYSTIMGKGQNDTDVRWVAEYILTRNLKTVTARDISRAYKPLGSMANRPKLVAVMAELANHDWVNVADPIRGVWKVNPAVHDGRFAAVKEAETARRASIRGDIARNAETRRADKNGEVRP